MERMRRLRARCCGKNLRIDLTGDGKRMKVDSYGEQYEPAVDEILTGTGRAPNVEGPELDAAGVESDNHNGPRNSCGPRTIGASSLLDRDRSRPAEKDF